MYTCPRCGGPTRSAQRIGLFPEWRGTLCPLCSLATGSITLPEGLTPVEDVTAAGWIPANQTRWRDGLRVSSVLPAVFEAYTRVFHPAGLRTGRTADGMPIEAHTRWAQIAELAGTRMHPLAQFRPLANLPEDRNIHPEWGSAPPEGSAPTELIEALTHVLAAHTTAPGACWFASWIGFGEYNEVCGSRARVVCEAREYVLYLAPITSVDRFARATLPGHSPQLWWPDDRAWIVATEIDLDSTYIGSSAACAQALLECPDLEALPAQPDDRIDYGSDTING